uniref:Uncharacterized protein n=1 Tax=Brassica oleracea TaxID=3712 RepID=A0A3P6GCV9_BRAOL|nr:unnamed protein product [Brassica oleracea]
MMKLSVEKLHITSLQKSLWSARGFQHRCIFNLLPKNVISYKCVFILTNTCTYK